jgi:hypothetical protein
MLPMGRRWDQHAKARCAIVCVVLGAHGLFALLLSQARQGVRRSQDDNHLIWLRLESPRELPSPPPPPPTPQARERVRESGNLFDSLKRDRLLPAPKPGSAIELPERIGPAPQSDPVETPQVKDH